MTAQPTATGRPLAEPLPCVFCRIIAEELPAHLVTADAAAIAILTDRPAALGHTLVIPRRHAEHIWDATADEVAAVMRTVHATATLLRDRLDCDGLTIRQNNGEASMQRVPHLHVHLVPRWHGDGGLAWPSPPDPTPDPTEVLRALHS
ncbi:MAG TPA: HIT domain-containing protein [Frankiaceae bacterium]|nr:histidine triad protein [Mycobacterium sp.]